MGRASGSFNSRSEIVVSGISGGSATDGITVNSSASVDTKGSWVTNAAYKPSFTWNLLNLMMWNAQIDNYVMDVGVDDGSGNVYVICPDLRVPGLRVARSGVIHYLLPLHVPQGKQLAFRCQSAAGGSNGLRILCGGSSNGHYGAQGYSRMVSLYTPAAGSLGITVDPGGTANTKGSWVQMTGSSSDRVVAVMTCIGDGGDIGRAANQNMAVDIGIGAGGSERVLIPDITFSADTNSDQWGPKLGGPYPCDVPSGTRFAMRTQCSVNTASDRLADFGLWGFVP